MPRPVVTLEARCGDRKPADTLVGVEALAHPDYLIEVEAVAVIDD